MANEITTTTNAKRTLTVADYAHNESFKKKIEETLGKRTPQFISSVLALVNTNTNFNKCNPVDIFNTCLMAASLDLPINKDLGQAWVIPYGNQPQLQIGWKGFVQLAQRSGLFKTINTTDVREGEIKGRDRLSGEIVFDWIEDDAEREKAPVVGYIAFFRLTNGFEKSLYMTVDELNAHGKKYSKSFNRNDALWKTDFPAMASKTVLKLLLNRYAPLSVDSVLRKAIDADQADADGNYMDNPRNIDVDGATLGSSEETDDANNIVEGDVVENADEN